MKLGMAKKQMMDDEQKKSDAMKRKLEGFAKSGRSAGACRDCNASLTAEEIKQERCPHCGGRLQSQD
jgi:hypothetical protein